MTLYFHICKNCLIEFQREGHHDQDCCSRGCARTFEMKQKMGFI